MHRYFFLILGALPLLVFARQPPPHLLSLGVGFVHGGKEHSGGLAQMEYKWGKYFWNCLRPQVSVATFKCQSLYISAGLAIELYVTDCLVFCPNFGPGLYFQGSGKDLGFPLEFRSCLELAYEMKNKRRIGVQFYHISNGSLSHKNPGMNASAAYFAFPF